MEKRTVVVLGASHKPERYAYKALMALKENGYRVIPVNPALKEIEGLRVIKSLDLINEPVWTLTLYVGPQRLEPMIDEIVELKPERVIANPGTELPALERRLKKAGIEYIEACTLVMLGTGQFE